MSNKNSIEIPQVIIASASPNHNGDSVKSTSVSSCNSQKTPFLVNFVAGGVAGTVGAVVTCPLEVVKTRFQSSQFAASTANFISSNPFKHAVFHVKGTLSAINGIYANEGIRALWKGVGATVVGVMPARAIYFSTYNKCKTLYSDIFTGGKEDSFIHLAAAASAGLFNTTLTNPIWMIKTRMQLQQQQQMSLVQNGDLIYRNSFDCLIKLVRNEGFKSLYKGLSASYMGVAEGTIQWVLYEKLKASLLRKHQHTSHHQQKSVYEWFQYFMAAATAKLTATIATYPHEVLRTRLRQRDQPRYTGLLETTKIIYREEGPSAFYGGMTAHLMRVVPNAAIMFLVYELIVHTYQKERLVVKLKE